MWIVGRFRSSKESNASKEEISISDALAITTGGGASSRQERNAGVLTSEQRTKSQTHLISDHVNP
jgi:hypothetical protein